MRDVVDFIYLARRAAPPPGRRRAVALLLAIVVAGMGGAGYLYSQRNVFRVDVESGQMTCVDVTVPMQRLGRSPSFVKQMGLPVSCKVSKAAPGEYGLQVTVVKTAHTLQRLRARVCVRAGLRVPAGTIRRSIKFTIDGYDGWPTATLVVTVRRPEVAVTER